MAAQKIALVTGAGSGIGRSRRLRFPARATRSRSPAAAPDKLEAVAKEADGTTLVVPTDVREPAAILALFAKSQRDLRPARSVVQQCRRRHARHAAGRHPVRAVAARSSPPISPAPFICTQEAIKIMKAQEPRGGRIINNGSISAHAPRPGTAAYTATKHAITGLTKPTALDCRAYDICCGQIDIGNAATPMTEKMAEGMLQADGSTRPEARMDVDDVGRAVVYMASLPLDANVLFMTVMANKMPFVGRG